MRWDAVRRIGLEKMAPKDKVVGVEKMMGFYRKEFSVPEKKLPGMGWK